MTKANRAALIAALMMGASGLMVTTPAMAKKDDKKDAAAAAGQPAPLKLTPEFQKGAIDAQTKLKANDLAGAEAALTQADAAAKNDDDNYISAQLHLGLEQAKLRASSGGDPAKFAAGQTALLPAINKLIDSPRTPQADKAKFLEARGGMYYDGGKFADAASDFSRAREAGSTNADIGLLIMKAKAESGDTDGAAAELQRAIDARGAGQQVPDTWYRYILSKYLKAKAGPQSVAWSQKLVKAYPTPVNWRAAVAVYATNISPSVKLDSRQQLDLLRLLRAAGALADENDYNDYAQKTDDLGLYGETLSVIDEGTKNGKLPAGNQLAKMLKGSSTTGAGLEKPLATQEAAARASKTGDLASQVGDSYLGRGDYAKAAEFYRLALTKPFEKSAGAATKRHFLDNDEVTMHLGIALARAGDKEGAKTAFNAITTSPRKEIAGYWLTWLDTSTPAAA